MQKNIIEYLVSRPSPATPAQHNNQKKEPFLIALRKKNVAADQNSISQASVVAN